MPIIDQYSDPSFRHFYAVLCENPHAALFVKTAEIDSEDLTALPDSAFAWREKRMFRIDQPDHAALSRLYVEKQAGVPDEVISQIDAALTVYGIKMPLTTKTASAPPEDAYIFPETRQYLVQDETDVKLACEGLLRNSASLDPLRRAAASHRLLKLAVRYGVSVPSEIHRMAGVTCSNRDKLAVWLEARSSVAREKDNVPIATAYTKLATSLGREDATLWDNQDLGRLVDSMSDLDKLGGLEAFYGKRFPDPVLSVYNTDKLASEEMVMVAGRPVPIETLESIPRDDYASIVGEDVADEFFTPEGDLSREQFGPIWDTIPYDMQKVLREQLGV